MTAQINDVFKYDNKDYVIAGISEGSLFEPSQLNLNPVGTCTACWRGYQVIFAVSEKQLIVDTLHVNHSSKGTGMKLQKGPVINGVTPTGSTEKYDMFSQHYVGLKYPLDYTGGLLLASGFISSLYVHMGFHPAWKYKSVIELVFSKGILEKEFDRSGRVAEVRQKVLDSKSDREALLEPSKGDIRAFVERSFDRTYTI